MAEDLIFSAFASADSGNLRASGLSNWEPREVQPVGELRDGARLIQIPKTGAPGKAPEVYGTAPFKRTMDRMRQVGGGSILSGLLRTYARGVEPRRIAVVGFSAGNKAVHDILENPADRELIDAVISLDGMVYGKTWSGEPVLSGFAPWMKFIDRASGLDNMLAHKPDPWLAPLMVHAHTHIQLVDPSTGEISRTASSTQEAADLSWELLKQRYLPAIESVPQEVIDHQAARQRETVSRLQGALGAMPYPVTIKCGGTSKRFAPDLPTGKGGVMPWIGKLGNYYGLDFEGRTGPDHCFIAYYAQRAIWQSMLIPRWNARGSAVSGLAGGVPVSRSLAGAYDSPRVDFRAPQDGQPGGAIVQPGALDTGSRRLSAAALTGGALAGATVGYLLARRAR